MGTHAQTDSSEFGSSISTFTTSRRERDDRPKPERVRLTPSEAAPLRYVLGGLSCADPGEWRSAPSWEPPSSCGAMIERLAQQASAENRSEKPTAQTMYVHHGGPGGLKDVMSVQERFTDQPRSRLVQIDACWSAIKRLTKTDTAATVTLLRLFGPEPPGLLERFSTFERWPDAVDADYRRVVDLATSGGIAALEARLRIEERKRAGEAEQARAIRVAAAKASRKALLIGLGLECERLIGYAVKAYRLARGGSPESLEG